MLVVVESVADASKLIQETDGKIGELNLGGTKPREGTINYSKTINLTNDEGAQLTQLQQSGVDVYIQQVPSEERQRIQKNRLIMEV